MEQNYLIDDLFSIWSLYCSEPITDVGVCWDALDF